ncbi:MAG: NAD-dependent epimerase/dehydratase family protein [Rhodospirillaceae bacterium]|nr:NAD-dependent epimerase/dehydratase family protein [Rhodospirillaceae bacterium]
MKHTCVAILGGSGQIGRSLAHHLPASWDIVLFTRAPQALYLMPPRSSLSILPYTAFANGTFDVIINAAGPGDPTTHRVLGNHLIRTIEAFDNLALDYLESHPETTYIHLSTGALYGPEYANLSEVEPIYGLPLSQLADVSPYHAAKLIAEIKHRSAAHLRIADLRIFGYFSRYIDLNSGFFLAQVGRALRDGQTFMTHATDFVRDCIAPEDLSRLIVALASTKNPNGWYDAYSAAPTTKFEILSTLEKLHGLCWQVTEGTPMPCNKPLRMAATTDPTRPFSVPSLSTLDLIVREMTVLLHGDGPTMLHGSAPSS